MLSEQDRQLLDRCVYNAPISILHINDEEKLDYLSKFIPYSTGFEIECECKPNISTSIFDDIPYLIENKSGYGELRFRIPSGVKGIICLYLISKALKESALHNPGSGIHYHIDFTDANYDIPRDFIDQNQSWILSELDTWNYGGTYNKRAVTFYKGNWFVFRGKTIEIRCGNMTFEYKQLIKFIISANSIVRKVKSLLIDESHVINLDNKASKTIDKEVVLLYLSGASNSFITKVKNTKERISEAKKSLKEANKIINPLQIEPTLNDYKNTINSRLE